MGTKKKKAYIILSKKSRQLYGSFPRTKEGYSNAKKYKEQLKKENKIDFIIK
jgi:hypothetical protein